MQRMSTSERHEIQSILNDRHNAALSAIAAEDPGWQDRIEERKTKLAIGKLRVEKEVVQLKAIESQLRALELQKQEVEARISRKMPLKEREYGESCPMPKSLCSAVAEIARKLEESVMAKDPSGKKALAAHAALRTAKAKLALCDTREAVSIAKIL